MLILDLRSVINLFRYEMDKNNVLDAIIRKPEGLREYVKYIICTSSTDRIAGISYKIKKSAPSNDLTFVSIYHPMSKFHDCRCRCCDYY